MFVHRKDLGLWDGEVIGTDTWMPLAPIWPETLRAPYSGRRTLEVHVSLEDTFDDDKIFFYDSQRITVDLAEIGWKEFPARRVADEIATIRLAMGVAAASVGLHEEELLSIKEWATEQVAYLDDDERPEHKERLNEAIRAAARDAHTGTIDIADELDRLGREGTPGGRLEAIELCLAVSRSDGRVDPEELERINRMADKLDVDREWYSGVRDKALRGTAIASDGVDDLAALLGIARDASPEEIRRELTSQYEKWSSRAVSLEDADRRAEAEHMLELTARAREELL